MKPVLSTKDFLLEHALLADELIGKHVHFRRDRLSPALVYEYGTMAVDTVYKVIDMEPGTDNMHINIRAPFFPMPITVSLNDIELTEDSKLDYESMIKPYEHLLELNDNLVSSEPSH